MKRSKVLLLLTNLCVICAYAVAPNGYYTSLNGKSGETLKNAIHSLVRPHTKLSYSSLWNHFPTTDVYPEKVNGKSIVWDMYSDNWNTRDYWYYGGTYGLNREHSVPKSWWNSPSNVEAFEAGTDIIHLFPSDGKANSAKSNYPLGEVNTSLSVKFDNGVSTVGYPSISGSGTNYVFEPDDEYKGDFARVYFYMATCYQDYTWKYTYMFNNSSYLTLNQYARNILLSWHRNDPVSQKERDRNDAVFTIQGNRNPFVDDPNLAEYIWGNRMGETYNGGGSSSVTGPAEIIYPQLGSSMDFGQLGVGKTSNLEIYVKGQNITGYGITLVLFDDNTHHQMFSLSTERIDAAAVNSANGYKLTITYKPTKQGKHSTCLYFYDGGITGSVTGVYINGECLDIPTLSAPVALSAENVTSDSYRAVWQAVDEEVDYYIITRSIYKNGALVTTEQVDTEETYYDFTREAGTSETYYVQSIRLGYTSPASNTITVAEGSGIEGVEANRILSIAPHPGGLRFICNESLNDVRIYNSQGVLVEQLDNVENDHAIDLPVGIYLITARESDQPIKAIVK